VVQTSVAWWSYVDVWCMAFFGKHHGYLMIYVTMKNFVCKDHITLQLKFKNHSSTTMLQLHLSNCNSYATTFYKYNDLINKFPHQKMS